MIIYLIISGILLLTISGALVYLIINNTKLNKKINEIEFNKNKPTTKFNLSFEDCDRYIENVMNDIWENKYLINYRLRDIIIIPEMDKEIKNLTEDIISSIGEPIKNEILNFYSYEYIIRRITRKAQMLFINYTNTYKPSTK